MNSQVSYLNKPRRNLVLAAIAAIVAVNSLILLAPDMESKDYYGNLLAPITASVAVAFGLIVVARQKLSGLFGRAYGALAFGLALWLVAEVLWSYYAIGLQIEAPFPSLADAFWLAGYGPLSYHLLVMARFYGRVNKQTLVIVSVATAIFATSYVNSVIDSSVLSGETELLPLYISIAYPVLDAMMVIPAVLVLLTPIRGQLTSVPWIFISWLLTTAGDAMFGLTAVANLTAEVTLWNLFYNAAYICMAAGLYWYNRYFIFDAKKLTNEWMAASR
jgi:hypothetical protein